MNCTKVGFANPYRQVSRDTHRGTQWIFESFEFRRLFFLINSGDWFSLYESLANRHRFQIHIQVLLLNSKSLLRDSKPDRQCERQMCQPLYHGYFLEALANSFFILFIIVLVIKRKALGSGGLQGFKLVHMYKSICFVIKMNQFK